MMNDCHERAKHSLCIQAVNLKESKVFVRDNVDLYKLNREGTAAQSFRSVTQIREITLTDPDNDNVETFDYRFMYSVGIRLIFSEEEKESRNEDYKPITEIFAIFEAKYLSQNKLNEDERKAYAADNVGYHVWPYWREYAQSTCARIGLSPAVEVPVYIIQRKEENAEGVCK